MNHGPLLFFGVFFALTVSWFGLVIAPHLQFGQQEMVVIEETGQSYPPARPGEARQGAEVSRQRLPVLPYPTGPAPVHGR